MISCKELQNFVRKTDDYCPGKPEKRFKGNSARHRNVIGKA
jgi:hypothetical protein